MRHFLRFRHAAFRLRAIPRVAADAAAAIHVTAADTALLLIQLLLPLMLICRHELLLRALQCAFDFAVLMLLLMLLHVIAEPYAATPLMPLSFISAR